MSKLLTVLLLVLISTKAIIGHDSLLKEIESSSCQGYWELSYQHRYLKEADSLWQASNLDRSTFLYSKAAKRFELEENWRGLIKARNRIAQNLRMNFQFDSAISILQHNLDLIEKHLAGDPQEVAEAYFLLGVCYDWDRKKEMSLEAHNQALQIRKQLYGEMHFDVARGYAAIGNMFGYIDQFQNAVKYLGDAVEIFTNLNCENSLRAGRTYYSLASAYRGLADYERANIYGLKALSILTKTFSGDRARCNLLLGNINFQMAQFDDALKFFFSMRCMSFRLRIDFQQTK